MHKNWVQPPNTVKKIIDDHQRTPKDHQQKQLCMCQVYLHILISSGE